MSFINRADELQALQKWYNEKQPHLIILYGKRRVGKTELIKQFIKQKKGIYYLASRKSHQSQIQEITEMITREIGDTFPPHIENWEELFRYMKERIHEPFTFVIDEYPYLVDTDTATSSIFQKGWDEYLSKGPFFVILSGSSIAMMEQETLVYKAPLYGRRSGQILVKPLPFYETHKFFPNAGLEKAIQFYSILGGIPAYLLKFSPHLSPLQNIREHIFNKNAFLYNEVTFILQEELREPRMYMSILQAISQGKRRVSEIAHSIGRAPNQLSVYLNTMENLHIIEREVPVTEPKPLTSKKSLYRISDTFFRFWFAYIYPYKSYLEIGNYKEVERKLSESFTQFVSFVYEDIVKEQLISYSDRLFIFERIGRWWDRHEEIDIVGLNKGTKEIVFCEVKWTKERVDLDVYENLVDKTKRVQWHNDTRKEYFALFSKNGFTNRMRKIAKDKNILLVEGLKEVT